MKIQNSKGRVYYGMHFYPGVAEYAEPDGKSYRVFLNEDTIRKMDPSFAGRPVFVMHVDGVEEDVNLLRNEADGWVVESFYNTSDGKHWVKFLIVSDKGEQAIKNGMRLSNCYMPKQFTQGGLWNGVSYTREITDGEFEHLALVPNPRYEESVVLTPDQFKAYNDKNHSELKRLANTKGDGFMAKFSLFKKTKIENQAAVDLEEMHVILPKTKREVTIAQLVNEADEQGEDAKKTTLTANPKHLVKVGENEMTVGELADRHKAVCDELEDMKKRFVGEDGDEDDDKKKKAENESSEDDDKKKKAENEDDPADAKDPKTKKNAADIMADVAAETAAADAAAAAAAKKANADDAAAAAKAAAKVKAERLRNANAARPGAPITVQLSGVELGKARYGA